MKRYFMMVVLVVAALVLAAPMAIEAQEGDEEDQVAANKAVVADLIAIRNSFPETSDAVYYAEDALIHIWGPGFGDQSAADAGATDEAFLTSMEGLHMEPCTIVGQGEYVAAYCYEEATFANDLGELPATGELWSLNVFNFYHFNEDGLIDEQWFTYNTYVFFQELGAIPADPNMLPEEDLGIEMGETEATPEENIAVAQAFKDALNAHDVPAALEFFSEDAYIYDILIGDLDVAGYGEAITGYQHALSEAWTIGDETTIVVAEGDLVFALDPLYGVFENELNGIPPNGGEMRFGVIGVLQIQDGEIVNLWSSYDSLTFITQLTAAPTEEGETEATEEAEE